MLHEQFVEKKRQITKSLISAMNNYPPLKKDITDVLEEIKKLYPEILALKTPMSKLSRESILTLPWLEVGVKYEMSRTVERRLKRKPFGPERAKDAFANLLWLVIVLFYMDDLHKIVTVDI